MDYGPALPPRLGPDPHDTLDQNVSASELPSKKVSDKPKKHCHSRSRHEIESRSASDQSNEESMNLGSHLLNLKNTRIRVNTNQGPDMCHLPQRRISPL